ncbi:Elongin-C [Diplonema papillatum]|nr:Elongin-C [Diplonema papillatum]
MPGKKQQEEKTPVTPFDVSTLVTLIGMDESTFIIDKKCAMVSKRIKSQLEELKEGDAPVVRFPSIRPEILEKAIQYFYYKHRYDNDPDDRPDFDVPPPIALDLMIVASYLGC